MLSNNRIIALPESIGQLTGLENLMLSDNRITSLPINFLRLSGECEINLQNNPLSETIRTRLQETMNVEGYQGPRILYSMTRMEPRGTDSSPVEETLRDLYVKAKQEKPVFNEHLLANPHLKTWLSRLSYMADYNAGGEKQEALLHNITNYLNLSNTDEAFREVFLGTIEGAAATCGDRMALSILHLGVQHQLATVDTKDPKKVANLLLRGILALDLLEQVAREKVPSLRFVDEIEVYLGYPVMLKEALALPIAVEDMLYFRCSSLSQTDLNTAQELVEGRLGNQEECHKFLIQQPVWLKTLEAHDPAAFKRLTDAKDAEILVDDPDYQAIEAKHQERLLVLTARALEEIPDERIPDEGKLSAGA